MATGQARHAYEVTFAAPPDLAELRVMWLDLESRAPTTRFFNSWSWIGHWLAMLPPGMEKRLLAARADGQWVGLGLLVCNTRKIGPLPFCRRWHLHECGNAAFDPWIEHNDFLIDAGHGDALRAALVAAWADAVGDAEELHLPGLRGCAWPQQVSGGLLRRDDSQSAYSVALDAVRNCDLDYTRVVAGSKRRLIRRSLKEYQTLGPLSVSVAQDAQQALAYFESLVQLHGQRWSEGGRRSTFDKAPSLALHRRVIADRIGHGEIQLLRAAAGDADIGYLYNFIHGRRVYYYQSGFDYSLLAKHGRPGFVTHALAIQHNAALGFDLYDLMAGDAEYKAALATAEETMTWSTWCKPALRFRCEHQLRRLKRAK